MITNKTAKFAIITIIVVIARFNMVSGQFAPAPAPGPAGEDCMTEVLSAADCLSFIQDGSNLTVPEKPCCPEVKSLLANHPGCLCQLIGQAASFQVNISRALQLPPLCKVKMPSLAMCPNPPASSPAGHAPSDSTPVTPALASSPTAGGGSGASGGAVGSVFALATALGVAILPIFF